MLINICILFVLNIQQYIYIGTWGIVIFSLCIEGILSRRICLRVLSLIIIILIEILAFRYAWKHICSLQQCSCLSEVDHRRTMQLHLR